MQHLLYITRLSGLLLVLLVAFSCKKEEPFDPNGTTTLPTTVLDPSLPIYEDWQKITTSYSIILEIQTNEDKLYFAGKNGTTSYIVQGNTLDNFSEMHSFSTPDFNVTDLSFFNGYLYYSCSKAPQLSKIHPVTFQNSTYDLGPSDFSVRDMESIQNKLFFTGYFGANSFIKSPYIECLSEADTTLGTYGTGIQVNGFFSDVNNDIYSYNVNSIKKWNGSSWVNEFYPYSYNIERIQSAAKRNDTTFITATTEIWNYNQYVFQYVVNGIPEYMGSLSIPSIDNDGYAKVCLLNGQIYLYGNGLSKNGVYTNVWRLSGNDWVCDAIIDEKVNDLEYFNGSLYAATDGGLYKY